MVLVCGAELPYPEGIVSTVARHNGQWLQTGRGGDWCSSGLKQEQRIASQTNGMGG